MREGEEIRHKYAHALLERIGTLCVDEARCDSERLTRSAFCEPEGGRGIFLPFHPSPGQLETRRWAPADVVD